MSLPLLLASGSPRRRELLRAAGIPFEVGAVPDVDEQLVPGASPAAAVQQLALRKAEAARRLAPERLLLTADTLVFLDGQALGKPLDAADANGMLQRLSGRDHEVLTGVAVVSPGGKDAAVNVGYVRTGVRFRELSKAEIADYVATGEPMDKAGAYAIQGGAAGFVEALEGPMDNVIGLPVALVRHLLARAALPS